MIETKSPNPKIVNQATGEPTGAFVGRPIDEHEVRVQFYGDKPEGGCNYEWDADPNYCVEWTEQKWDFKRKFRVVERGWIRCRLVDSNGFYYDVPGVPVAVSGA